MWAVNGGGMASKIWVRAITTAAAIGLLMPMAVIGQSTGGATTPPTTGGTGASAGRTTSTSPTTPTTSPTGTPASVSVPQPVFISGRVTMEDGTAPPGGVVIETVCRSEERRVGEE